MKVDQFLQDLLVRSEKKDGSSYHTRDVHIWRILSVLRGPDFTDKESSPNYVTKIVVNDELKWLTTARIRHIVFGCPALHELGYDNNPLFLDINTKPLNDKLRARRDVLLSESNSHFRDHINTAYESIRELYDYDLYKEEEVKVPHFKVNGA